MKANRTIRDKALGGVNWWDYLNSIRPKGFRNEPQYIDKKEVINGGKLIRIADKLTKKRRRAEKKTTNHTKHNKRHRIGRSTQKHKHESKSIQHGFDLAKWWGEQLE